MPRKSNWNSPTTAIRIPQHCADDLMAIAKLLDRPALEWDDAIDTKAQVVHRLSQFHTCVEVLVRELKRTPEPSSDQYHRFVNALWDAVERFKESNYRLFCDRLGQQPAKWPMPIGFGDLVEILGGPHQGERGYVHIWEPAANAVTVARSDWASFPTITRSQVRLIERQAMTDAERQAISALVIQRHQPQEVSHV